MKSSNNSITLKFPNKNQGKFRFKERTDHLEFGKSFATLKSKFK